MRKYFFVFTMAVILSGCPGEDPGSGSQCWTAVANTPSSVQTLSGIAWGENTFVAVGHDYQGNSVYTGNIVYSVNNGETWQLTTYADFMLYNIAWGPWNNGTFVLGGNEGIAYSGDGYDWITVRDYNFKYSVSDIAWGNDKFVAVGNFGSIAYSDDGGKWSPAAVSAFGDSGVIDGVAWGKDKFIAVGSGTDNSGNKMAYSYDGIDWFEINGVLAGFYSAVWGNDKFVAVGRDGKIAYSSDGIQWDLVTDSTFDEYDYAATIYDVAWGSGLFVAVGERGKIAYSSDGINWAAETNSTFGSSDIRGIAWGNGRFVAVGEGGKIAYLKR